jgi:hypothetical protein
LPATEAAVTTKVTAKPSASRTRETTTSFFTACQFTAESATVAAVTTKAIPKPIASRKRETTYLFFMVPRASVFVYKSLCIHHPSSYWIKRRILSMIATLSSAGPSPCEA